MKHSINSQSDLKTKQIYYLMNFSLFNQYDVELFSAYKQFVQSTIIQLGQSWRIQSGLLSKQIVSMMNSNMAAEAEATTNQRLQFNIFNQFLQPFLKNKIGCEKEECSVAEAVIQQKFTDEVNKHFSLNGKITDSVIFKSLSLGFCINAIDMWVKNFSTISDNDNNQYFITPLGVLHRQIEKKNQIKILGDKSSMGAQTIQNNFSDIDLGSCHHSNSEMEEQKTKNYQQGFQKKWSVLKDISIFTQQEMKGINHIIKKVKYTKFIALSCLAVNIHEISTGTKKVRVISIGSQFYRSAFIIWLIFNIKLFFSISLEQYIVYFKYLMPSWEPSLQLPLKKFYIIIQKQWNLLRKDYSVPLHDDLEVLKNLINRVKCSYQDIWKMKREEIYKKICD